MAVTCAVRVKLAILLQIMLHRNLRCCFTRSGTMHAWGLRKHQQILWWQMFLLWVCDIVCTHKIILHTYTLCYVAIEPILANGELEKATNNYQNLAIDNAKLQIIMGGTSFLDQAKVLSKKITSSAGKVVDISIETYLKESHASVYYPALNSGLRNHFEDYRRPSKEQILTQNFNYQSILKYFEKRASKYKLKLLTNSFSLLSTIQFIIK